MEYDVAAVPTCIFIRAGEILDRVEGAKAADMSKMVRNFVAQKVTFPSQGILIYSDSKGLLYSRGKK